MYFFRHANSKALGTKARNATKRLPKKSFPMAHLQAPSTCTHTTKFCFESHNTQARAVKGKIARGSQKAKGRNRGPARRASDNQ
jgi:hypothetical protein